MTLQDFLDEWRGESPVVQVSTSGSTGKPKAMSVLKSRMRVSAISTCGFLELQPGDTALLCMPVDYIAGKMMVVRAETCGLTLTCVEPSSHPLEGVNDDARFDLIAMVPMQVYCSLQCPREREILRRTRHLIIGGGAVSDELCRQLRDFPNAVWSTYGMTETLSHVALRRLNGEGASQWYTPMAGVDVAVDSDRCLVISAPEICAEPVATHDVAELADDGRRFRIIGRIDNVICSGGIKIHIEEVEALLQPLMPCEFMITKLKDDKYGEVCVMLYTGQDLKAVREACAVLPRYYVPKQYIRVSALPYTPTGKPARAEAAFMAAGCKGQSN